MSYARSFWAATGFLVFLTAATPASAYVQITSGAPPGGGVGVSYSHRYSFTDSDSRCYVHGGEWSLSLASGALPPGLSLHATTTVRWRPIQVDLHGIPTTAGTYTGTVKATHCGYWDSQAFNIVIVDTPPVFPVSSVEMPVGSVGAPYSFSLTATGTTPITYTLTAGALPDGLTLSTAGLVSGTPITAGSFAGTVTASNGVLPDGSLPFIIVIADPQPLITSSVPPDGSVGVPYTFSYTATGSVPITYSVTEGALPYGLTLSTAGVIDGTPTTDGTFTGTVTASNGISPDDVQDFSIVIMDLPPIITNGPPPSSGTIGTPFSFAYTATGTPPISYSLTAGALPDGLTLSTAGVIDGTPTTEGYYSGTVTASDGTLHDATQDFSIQIILLGPPVFTSDPPPDGSVGYSYTFACTASGATNIEYSVTAGALPPGLGLNPNGDLGGYPTTAGTYAGTVTASSGMAPDAVQDFVIEIVEGAPVFTGIASESATVGTPYASTFEAVGSKPMTYSVTAGVLPDGLTLSAEGLISGTPTSAGTFTGTVTVSNGVLPDATHDFSIKVQEGTPVVPVDGGGSGDGGGGGGGALDGITCVALLLLLPLLRARRRRAATSSVKGTSNALAAFGVIVALASASVWAQPTQNSAATADHPAGRITNGRIAWVEWVYPDGGLSVFTAAPDGSDVRQVTFPDPAAEVFDSHPAWTEDGSAIVFERDVQDLGFLYRINADGGGLRALGDCTNLCLGNVFPAAGPEGRIAYVKFLGPVLPSGEATSGGIWIMSADGAHEVQVTQKYLPTASEDRKPTWSPDGKRLAFTRLNNSSDAPYGRQAIFVANVDGSEQQRLTPWRMDANSADWSPDGQLILFTSHEDPFTGPTESEHLYTMRPDGSDMKRVVPAGLAGPDNGKGRFSPDGKKIIFVHTKVTRKSYDWSLYTMNLDGSNVTLVRHNEAHGLGNGGQFVDNPTWGTHR